MIEITNLCYSYTKEPFIENMNLSVKSGEIFGFLGPSGAGKSTLQKLLIGLLLGYRGSAIVNGTEVRSRDNRFYEHIGVDFEYPSLYEKWTARENLTFFASLYAGKTLPVDELLSSVLLLRDGDKKVSDYSKGMKSRLSFIKALIHKPTLLFLDEPTSGLDPSNARIMKDMILREKSMGTTILLTTHNMEDAAKLCDRVAFIVDGTVAALDTPHNLIMKKGASRLHYSYIENGKEIEKVTNLADTAKDSTLKALISENRIATIHSTEPSLGDIFMDITGRSLS